MTLTPWKFTEALMDRFPRARLTNEQQQAFVGSIDKYRLDFELVDTIAETCERAWPALADVAKHASRQKHADRPYLQPHTWSESDCRHCRGEGRLALFGEFLAGAGGSDEFQIQSAAPYSSQDAAALRFEGTLIEMFARCVCDAGDAATLGAGIPKWGGHLRHFRRSVER